MADNTDRIEKIKRKIEALNAELERLGVKKEKRRGRKKADEE